LVTTLAFAAPCWPQSADEKAKAAQKAEQAKAEQAKAEQEKADQKRADEARRVDEGNRVRRVFQLKHVDPLELLPMLHVFPVEKHANQRFKTISVSGSREMVAAVEETIRRFDVPASSQPVPLARNVDLTVHLLIGEEQPSTEAPPAALKPVVDQLTTLFPYKGYRLAETLVMRTRDGTEGHLSGMIRLAKPRPEHDPRPSWRQAPYSFSFRRATIREGEKAGLSAAAPAPERQIRLDHLELGVDVPHAVAIFGAPEDGKTPFEYKRVGLKTDIDVREGQKVVVGKATLDGTGQALILVVTAKVIE
jgi:hypothetical protein